MNTYRPKHFKLAELVCPQIMTARADRAWELLQLPALVTLDQLRDKFGALTVNDWHMGGHYQESGLRTFTTSTGAEYSQHKFGGAFDCKFKTVTPAEAADYIKAHADEFPFLTTIENPAATPTWLHFDVRNHGRAGIWVVNP